MIGIVVVLRFVGITNERASSGAASSAALRSASSSSARSKIGIIRRVSDSYSRGLMGRRRSERESGRAGDGSRPFIANRPIVLDLEQPARWNIWTAELHGRSGQPL